jgi:hypothetical protein
MAELSNGFNDFSPHLFWDVDKASLSWKKNSAFLVERILDYGMMTDWHLLRKNLSLEQITQIAMNLRNLDTRSLHFIAAISDVPIEKFRCYTIQQSTPQHWNF